MPDPHNIPLDLLRNRTYASDPDMEQVVTLTLVGVDAMKNAGELLHQILLPGDKNQSQSAGDCRSWGDQQRLVRKGLPCLAIFIIAETL